MNIFYAWQVRKSLSPSYVPEDISIEATNTCNFRCSFCPQSDPKHHEIVPRTYLEPERAESIFKKIREGGVSTDTLHWTLDGEPFMNKKFAELCGIAIKYNFTNMYFATNGLLLSEDRLGQLPVGGKVRYTFTIDYCADQEYFEDVRGNRQSWKAIYDNIQSSLRNESHSNIFFVLSDITTYKTLDPTITNAEFDKLKNLFAGYESRIKFYSKTFHNAAGLTSKLVKTSSEKRYHLCPYPWTSLVIASSGDVVACCRDLRRQTVLGNILQQSLREIWRGAAAQELRKNLVAQTPWKSAACDGCDMPYDDAKFSLKNLVRTARGRLQILRGG
jgi:radical SAM protein with 4Fe4S-binding SPASM domain